MRTYVRPYCKHEHHCGPEILSGIPEFLRNCKSKSGFGNAISEFRIDIFPLCLFLLLFPFFFFLISDFDFVPPAKLSLSLSLSLQWITISELSSAVDLDSILYSTDCMEVKFSYGIDHVIDIISTLVESSHLCVGSTNASDANVFTLVIEYQ